MIDLNGGDATFFGGAAQDLGDRLHATEGAEVLRVALLVLLGAAVVRVDAHDQAWDFDTADSSSGYATAFEVAFHRLIPVVGTLRME